MVARETFSLPTKNIFIIPRSILRAVDWPNWLSKQTNNPERNHDRPMQPCLKRQSLCVEGEFMVIFPTVLWLPPKTASFAWPICVIFAIHHMFKNKKRHNTSKKESPTSHRCFGILATFTRKKLPFVRKSIRFLSFQRKE